jgi:predicted component of type VI protein secretion system
MSEAHYRESLKAAKAQENPVVRENCIAILKETRKAAVALILPRACASCPLRNGLR